MTLPMTARIQAALDELQETIAKHHPEATFEVVQGEDPEAFLLRATVDVENLHDVVDLVLDRLVEIQVEEELPVSIVPRRTPGREAAVRASLARPALAQALLP